MTNVKTTRTTDPIQGRAVYRPAREYDLNDQQQALASLFEPMATLHTTDGEPQRLEVAIGGRRSIEVKLDDLADLIAVLQCVDHDVEERKSNREREREKDRIAAERHAAGGRA